MIEVFTSCVAVNASQTHLMSHFTFPQICQKFCQFLHKFPGRIDTIHIKQVSNCLVIQMAQSNWTCLSERQMAPNSLTKDSQLTRSRRTPRTTVADNPPYNSFTTRQSATSGSHTSHNSRTSNCSFTSGDIHACGTNLQHY